MRRRLTLALLAAAAAAAVAVLAARVPGGAARARHDTRTTPARPDSVAPADSLPDYDPPCLASRLGLACRS